MTRPNITKFQASEIGRAAKAAYFRYLATARLEQAAVALGVVLERDELMTHEREIFDTEFKALEDCYLGTCSGRCKSTVAP